MRPTIVQRDRGFNLCVHNRLTVAVGIAHPTSTYPIRRPILAMGLIHSPARWMRDRLQAQYLPGSD